MYNENLYSPAILDDVRSLSDFLSVHPWTIRYWAKSGKIKAYRMGRILRFDRAEVLQSFDQNAKYQPRSLKNRLRQKASKK